MEIFPGLYVLTALILPCLGSHQMVMQNRCGREIWVGILGNSIPDQGKYKFYAAKATCAHYNDRLLNLSLPLPSLATSGRSDQAMVLGNFQCCGVLLISIIVGQRPTVFSVGAGGVCLDFSLPYRIFILSTSFQETA